jgi:hypothetical protein
MELCILTFIWCGWSGCGGVWAEGAEEAERALSQVFYGHEIQWLSMPLHDTGLRATPYSEFPDPIKGPRHPNHTVSFPHWPSFSIITHNNRLTEDSIRKVKLSRYQARHESI